MGITSAEVAFPHHAPPVSDICARATEICSLPVVVLESYTDKLLEFHALIAFECAQDRPLDLFAYRQGSVAGSVGVAEPADTQTVHLQGFAGEDPTLMVTTRMALESLGGTSSRELLGDDRREFGQTITESELMERLRKAKRHMRRIEWTLILMLPILIPWFAVVSVWNLVTTPFRRGHRNPVK